MRIYHYDAFCQEPNKGNPAGIVINEDGLTDEEMQEIALKVGFNETSFVLPSDVADIRIRFFTPGHEMNVCGHATIATTYMLKSRGLLLGKDEVTIETKAGILPIKIQDNMYITMRQAAPQFIPFEGSRKELAHAIGLREEDIDDSLPIVYGSTGIWTLVVPIKKLESFEQMNPTNKLFPTILKEMPTASIHPFCFETYDATVDMHARHFSSPYSGTVEDAVTGTASGVMGAFYATYVNDSFDESLQLLVEQGQEMGKDGRVIVEVTKNKDMYDVEITGTAVYVGEFEVVV
jgi:PhzF family phenazine biosynthesis protein